MNNMFLSVAENNSAPLVRSEIPVLNYTDFSDQVYNLLKDASRHCIAYYAVPSENKLMFICCIGDDEKRNILVFSCLHDRSVPALQSLTPLCPQLHAFEREIYENHGILFEGHPWLKPVRYPHDRADRNAKMENYPFYSIESEELHEVGVGPIHAGVIEPGHFRFICNGEKVLHLEIQLGYQHRGVEKLFIERKDPILRCILSESIAGDSAVAHGLAHAQLIESLADIRAVDNLQIERCIALELERLAVHIGDTAALCGDVAYQLGQAVCEALRTTIINTTQMWCGNRFGKGLIRPGGTNYPMDSNIVTQIIKVTGETGKRFREISERIYSLPSLLARFEDIGTVTTAQAMNIGAVGMSARTCNIPRDIRKTHPFQYYRRYPVKPVTTETGDVLARGLLRSEEAAECVRIIRELAEIWLNSKIRIDKPVYKYKLKPDSFAVSVIEGWRGEICHSAVTDDQGEIIHYKVKDPSFHNWMALALAVRNQEISDFPICNKSFNLSYCGNDL